MINDENLATAHIAQLFGSELLKVQNSSQTDAGSAPDIVKIDPKQFLINSPQAFQARKLEEQRLMQALQREAEANCPYESSLPIEKESPLERQVAAFETATFAPQQKAVGITQINNEALERIAISLEQIVELLKTRTA